MVRREACVLLALALAADHSQGAAVSGGGRDGAVRVLFIGNSYTFFNEMPSIFGNLSAHLASPVRVVTGMVAPGGSSLFQHANLTLPMGIATAAALSTPEGWDYVVLQDQSETAGGGCDKDDGLAKNEGFLMSSHALADFYGPRILAAGGTAVMYSTWGRHDGDAPNAACCGYGTFLSMNRLTTAGYRSYATTLQGNATAPSATESAGVHVRVAPAGQAFELAHNSTTTPLDPSSNFSCLYNHADTPPGPNRNCTLDGAGLGGHPSLGGSYMIAAVIAGTIHRQSVLGVSWAPAGVPAAEAQYLLKVADQAIRSAQVNGLKR